MSCKETIAVAMAFDANYFFPSCVTACSVMEHSDPEKRYEFFLLTERSIAGQDHGVLGAMAEKYPNFSWKYVPIVPELIPQAGPRVFHVTTPTYFRLVVSEVIPEHDRCIYLDSDILVCEDIARLYDLCDASTDPLFNECYVAAVPDMVMQAASCGWTTEHLGNISFGSAREYFNGGVVVFNLKKLREDRMVPRFLEISEEAHYFADQDALNLGCVGNVLYLPGRYNLLTPYIGNPGVADEAATSDEEWQIMMHGPAAICHYAGDIKPWDRVETVWEQDWYDVARKLPRNEFVDEQLRRCEQNVVDRVRDNLLPKALGASGLVLYGFSPGAEQLCRVLHAEGAKNIICFCDRAPEKIGLSYRGISCHAPDIIPELPEDTMIIICPQRPWRSILQDLTDMGVDAGRIARFRARDSRIISLS